ncbi:hypothetical protein SeLEV6574_g04811 [Synchytrium endobioticum]|uniref:Mitochondrial inner membrane protease ATP23 n=1 Tax=Synchytrium endobioticum TaxID=286115 RepID=A0A507CXI9_9FUNG|nr:hypothetical protein SeLEV6574_g04811 [Synchytrium endobioticum]
MTDPPPQPPAPAPSDDVAFTRWRAAISSLLAPAPPLHQEHTAVQEQEHARCQKWKAYLLQHSPIVSFLATALPSPLHDSHYVCMPCPPSISGGFAPQIGIVLCQNRLVSQRHMEDTLAHELVHVYDHETTDVSWARCEQYACSEIRAAMLSGECRFMRELRRGFVQLNKGHQSCVRRRAALALSNVPHCQGENVAEDAIRNVWAKCFSDTAPFDEIY